MCFEEETFSDFANGIAAFLTNSVSGRGCCSVTGQRLWAYHGLAVTRHRLNLWENNGLQRVCGGLPENLIGRIWPELRCGCVCLLTRIGRHEAEGAHRGVLARAALGAPVNNRSTRSSTTTQHSYSTMPTATNAPSRSPSPAPAPPVAEAPGHRAQGLINVFNKASKATLDKCSSENFASCFPTAAQYAPETLEGLRSQIVDQLDRTWKANFEEILKKRDVVKLVNELEQCIEDAKLRKKRAEASANGGPVDVPVP
jgi:hypothetical protein